MKALPRWERIALDWLNDQPTAAMPVVDQPTVLMPIECPLCPPGMAMIDCPGHDEKEEA